MFFNRRKWHRVYDNVTEQTWSDKTYIASDYIFNKETTTIVNDNEFNERQALSDVILPRPDNKVDLDYVNAGYVDTDYTFT